MTSRTRPGILYHKYGPHIFHTNSDQVVDYLSQFTEWRPYEHRVLAQVRGQLVPIPINRTTLNMLFDADLEDRRGSGGLSRRARRAGRGHPDVRGRRRQRRRRASSTSCSSAATRASSGASIRRELDKQVTQRIPTRTNADDRYFGDTFQAMPLDGYTAMFERMLDHPQIERRLGVDFRDVRDEVDRRPPRLHRTDRRIFRLPLRQAALPEPAVRSPDARPGAVPAGRGRSIIHARTCPTRGSANTSI